MPVSEYRAWVDYFEDEPFGDVRADLRAGIIASLIARTMGGVKNAKPIDFMPIVASHLKRAETQDQRVALMRAGMESVIAGMKVRRTKKRKG